ncbi:hypothetical protein QC762_0012260 [Podospora pseudocomata]|uniref:Uncharacterized protein n=1 Tax=Podospora pseudocomata TaxID=2093779 RepID=A0ABR0GVZ9_9PEZI|nr:hypothetical protein QC762_0012260 [Podospora pseudocomata]
MSRSANQRLRNSGPTLASTTSHERFTPSGNQTNPTYVYLIPYPRATPTYTPDDLRIRCFTARGAQFDNRRRRAQPQLVQQPDSRIPSHPTHTHLGERSIITNHLSIASDHRLQPSCFPSAARRGYHLSP